MTAPGQIFSQPVLHVKQPFLSRVCPDHFLSSVCMIKPFLSRVCMIINWRSGGAVLCDHLVITFCALEKGSEVQTRHVESRERLDWAPATRSNKIGPKINYARRKSWKFFKNRYVEWDKKIALNLKDLCLILSEWNHKKANIDMMVTFRLCERSFKTTRMMTTKEKKMKRRRRYEDSCVFVFNLPPLSWRTRPVAVQ